MFYGGICLALNILAALKTTSHCLIFREGEDRLEVRRRKLQTVDHAQVVWACGIFTLKELIYCGWIHRPLIQGTEPRVGKKVKFL